MGAPNVVRGASHAGKVSALEIVEAGLVTALASDYHYPAPLRAALRLVELGVCDMPAAWELVSGGPARVLGLSDRGTLVPGMRADLLVLDRATGQVGATLANGAVTYMTGMAAARFIA